MKKAFITVSGLFIIAYAIIIFFKPNEPQDNDINGLSPFIGMWEWVENNQEEQDFAIWVGERNDSLLFGIGGVFYGGLKIHMPDFDEDGNILIKASRAEGLQPNMEMVVFALKKSDGEDAIPVPLYNATAITVGSTKSSTLKIWRKSDKKGAKKIIKKLEKDLDEAKEEYDFIAAADGFAQWPDFIDQQNTVKK